MCLLCAPGADDPTVVRRARVLQMLALVERPDALPAAAALRLAREILVLTEAERTSVRCDAVLLADGGDAF